MRPVWVNEELMVSPSAVAGLISTAETDSYGPSVGVYRWVSVVLLDGHQQQVWTVSAEVPIGDAGFVLKEAVDVEKARQRVLAGAEVERLSALLWPEPSGDSWKTTVPPCRVPFPSDTNVRCVLDAGHSGAHRSERSE